MNTPSLLAALLLCPFSATTGEAVRLWIERSSDLAYPRDKLDLATVPKDSAGNRVIPSEGSHGFFRTQIQIIPDGAGLTLLLAQVLADQSTLAKRLLLDGKRGAEPWPADWVLGPDVFPIYDKAGICGATPAFQEFKVSRNLPLPERHGFLKNFNEDCLSPDVGSLAISLTDADSPQQESSQEGPAITEVLWKLARRRDVKIFRCSADFFAAEDIVRHLLARFGTQPFKPDPLMPTQLTGPLIWRATPRHVRITTLQCRASRQPSKPAP